MCLIIVIILSLWTVCSSIRAERAKGVETGAYCRWRGEDAIWIIASAAA